MADLILYSYWRSSCSYRVRIALELKGLAYETRAVHLVRDGGEQRGEDYRTLNPMGQVPCLVHEGVSLSQSMAIIEYLETRWPQPALFPSEPIEPFLVEAPSATHGRSPRPGTVHARGGSTPEPPYRPTALPSWHPSC